MAITTLDSMISGLRAPIDFVTGLSGTLVAGRPVDLNTVPVTAALASWLGCLPIYYTNTGDPTTEIVFYTGTSIPWSAGQEISVSACQNGTTHDLEGCWTIASVGSLSITVNRATSVALGGGGQCGAVASREFGSPGYGGLNGSVMTSWPAQYSFVNPASGNTYLARLEAQAPQGGSLLLCDRLWFACGINTCRESSFVQTFPSVARIPSRDMNGSNSGHGVLAAVEFLGTPYASSTEVGVATLTYTNQSGDTGHTASLIIDPVAKPPHGTFYPFGLQEGDTGIRQVESLTVSTRWDTFNGWTAQTCLGLVLYRILARLPLTANTRGVIDALTGCFPRLFDNTVPFLVFVPQTTTSSNVVGMLQYAQG